MITTGLLIRTMFSLLAGIALGIFFFGGLWTTVRHGMTSDRPALWFLGSFVLRLAVLLAGLYLVMRYGRAAGSLAALVGIIAARVLTIRMARRTSRSSRPENAAQSPTHGAEPRS